MAVAVAAAAAAAAAAIEAETATATATAMEARCYGCAHAPQTPSPLYPAAVSSSTPFSVRTGCGPPQAPPSLTREARIQTLSWAYRQPSRQFCGGRKRRQEKRRGRCQSLHVVVSLMVAFGTTVLFVSSLRAMPTATLPVFY